MTSNNLDILKSMKASYYKSLDPTNSNNYVLYKGPYNKSNEKYNSMEYELERSKEMILHLRTELAAKKKEISLLKVNKNRKTEENKKNMKVIEEILKQCDQSTKSGFTTIENKICNSELNNEININKYGYQNKKYKMHLPQIGDMLHFTTKHKNIMKEMVIVNLLKEQINNLNEELIKKDEKINELEKYKNTNNFTKLQNNYIKNFNELNVVKKENEFMKDKIENVNNLLIAEKEDNFNLKNKFQNFYNKYRLYKDTTIKKTTALENMLLKLKNKQKECKIFHIRKGNSAINARTGSAKGGGGGRCNSMYEKNDLEESGDISLNKLYEENIKMNKTINQFKIEQDNKNNEIQKLTQEKQNIAEKIEKLEKEKNEILINNENLNKQIQEEVIKRNNAENSIKEQDTRIAEAKTRIESLEKENNELKENNKNKNKEIEDIKEMIKIKEEENKKLNSENIELEKKN